MAIGSAIGTGAESKTARSPWKCGKHSVWKPWDLP